MKIALFAGSFDPFTLGHLNITERALPLFDKIIIGIGHNNGKKNLFSLEERVSFIRHSVAQLSNIEIVSYKGLTGKFCLENEIGYLIRGLRNTIDFQYEFDIAAANKQLFNIETIFIPTDVKYAHISSSLIRDLYLNGGDYQQYLPQDLVIQ